MFYTVKIESSTCWMYLISVDILIFTPLIRSCHLSFKASIPATNKYPCHIPLDIDFEIQILVFYSENRFCVLYIYPLNKVISKIEIFERF